jgi:polyhydroxyalkanoate synthesis regulator phasin
MSKNRWFQAGAAGLLLALVVGGIAMAGGRSNSPASAKDKQKYADLYVEKLAARLGISADALRTAGKQAAEDVIAQALKDGKITQEEATRLRERISSGDFNGFGFPRFGKHSEDRNALKEAFTTGFEATAKKLGMTTGALRESLRSGKTIADLAKAKGVTLASLGAAVADAVKPVIDRLVKDGVLSQERANSLLAKVRSGGFFAFKFGGHHRGFKGFKAA